MSMVKNICVEQVIFSYLNMTFKQIGLIDDKYINLVIVFLKHIVYYRNLTCFIIYVWLTSMGHMSLAGQNCVIQMIGNFICNSNTIILNLGLNIFWV